VTSEYGYKSDFPELLCLDADTGEILWQRQINHLEQAIPDPAAREKVAGIWRQILARQRIVNALKMVKDPEARKEWEAKLAANPMPSDQKTLGRYSLGFEAFRNYAGDNGKMVGTAFPTPCTDGEYIYVHTLWSQIACYDFDGNVKWFQWYGKKKRDVRIGKERMKEFFRSPVLWNDPAGNGAGLLIVDMEVVRAFDRRTGDVRWEVDRAAWNVPLDTCHGEHLSPKIFRVGETDFLWSYSPSVPVAIRLADGKSFPVEGWKYPGTGIAVNSDASDTLFLAGGSHHGGWANKGECETPPPAGIKLSFDGHTLTTKPLWFGLHGKPFGGDDVPLAYAGGRAFLLSYDKGFRSAIVDAETGKVLKGLTAGGTGERVVPPTRHMFAIASGRIYGLGRTSKVPQIRKDDEPCEAFLDVYDLDGKRLATNAILGPRIEGEFKAMSLAAAMPNWFSYSCPFTLSGDRIYIRSNYLLHCIGERRSK
jgi:hypothetical protein